MNPLRRQLPVLSALPVEALTAALGRADRRDAIDRSLGSIFDAPDVILTDSGTSALGLAMRLAARSRTGSHCALPAFGCFDLATAALAAGVRVALYDVDPATLAPDERSIRAAMDGDCASLVLVHHYGVPAPAAIMDDARARGILLIEDAAQAAGARLGPRRLGSLGDASVFSFGRGKGVTAGSGGALLLRGERGGALVNGARAALLPHAGSAPVELLKLTAQWTLARPAIYAVPARLPFLRLGETVFHEPWEPTRMSPLASRVLQRTLPLMDEAAQVRSRHAARLRAAQAAASPSTLVAAAHEGQPGWLRLPVLLPIGATPSAAASALLGAGPSYPLPLSELDPLLRLLVNPGHFAGATALSRRLWTLPTHERLAERDLLALERWIKNLTPP